MRCSQNKVEKFFNMMISMNGEEMVTAICMLDLTQNAVLANMASEAVAKRLQHLEKKHNEENHEGEVNSHE